MYLFGGPLLIDNLEFENLLSWAEICEESICNPFFKKQLSTPYRIIETLQIESLKMFQTEIFFIFNMQMTMIYFVGFCSNSQQRPSSNTPKNSHAGHLICLYLFTGHTDGMLQPGSKVMKTNHS